MWKRITSLPAEVGSSTALGLKGSVTGLRDRGHLTAMVGNHGTPLFDSHPCMLLYMYLTI